jgi:rod shape-determining protein MreD
MRIDGRVWATVALLVILHFTLHTGFGIGAGAPDLLVVALLVVAREVPMGAGAGIGLTFGLLEDAFSALAFGANAVAMTVIGTLATRTRDLFVGDSRFFLPTYFFLGKAGKDLVYWLMAGDAVRDPFAQAMFVESPVAALYATLVGTAVAMLTGVGLRAR